MWNRGLWFDTEDRVVAFFKGTWGATVLWSRFSCKNTILDVVFFKHVRCWILREHDNRDYRLEFEICRSFVSLNAWQCRVLEFCENFLETTIGCRSYWDHDIVSCSWFSEWAMINFLENATWRRSYREHDMVLRTRFLEWATVLLSFNLEIVLSFILRARHDVVRWFARWGHDIGEHNMI